MAKPRSIDELMSDYRAELTRLFLQPDSPPNKVKCGNVSYIGMDIFSYGSPILRLIRIEDDKKPFLAISATAYSVTSSKHAVKAHFTVDRVLSPLVQWTTPLPDCSTTRRYAPEYLLELVDKAISQMQSTRTRPITKIGALVCLDRYLDDYELFVKHAGMPHHEQLAALQQARTTSTEDEYIMHCRALAALNA